MVVDSVTSSHPIVVNVNNPNQINEVFDSISYSKVSHVTNAVWRVFGEGGVLLCLQFCIYLKNCFYTFFYFQGSAIIGMLEAVMGQDKFFEGVGVMIFSFFLTRKGIFHRNSFLNSWSLEM